MTIKTDKREGLSTQLRKIRALVRQNIDLLRGIYTDSRTPKLAKALLWAAIGYALLPVDLIPDFIPVIGQLDDLILVPAIIYLALKMVPTDVYEEHRLKSLL